MIMEMMRNITDMSEYMSILNIIRTNNPLTKEEIDDILPLYHKYGHHAGLEIDANDIDFIKICLIVDIMKLHETTSPDQFAGFEFTDNTLNFILISRSIYDGSFVIDETNASDIAAKVLDEKEPMTARIILGRIALDEMTVSEHFDAIQRPIREIANFLVSIKNEAHKYVPIIKMIRGG